MLVLVNELQGTIFSEVRDTNIYGAFDFCHWKERWSLRARVRFREIRWVRLDTWSFSVVTKRTRIHMTHAIHTTIHSCWVRSTVTGLWQNTCWHCRRDHHLQSQCFSHWLPPIWCRRVSDMSPFICLQGLLSACNHLHHCSPLHRKHVPWWHMIVWRVLQQSFSKLKFYFIIRMCPVLGMNLQQWSSSIPGNFARGTGPTGKWDRPSPVSFSEEFRLGEMATSVRRPYSKVLVCLRDTLRASVQAHRGFNNVQGLIPHYQTAVHLQTATFTAVRHSSNFQQQISLQIGSNFRRTISVINAKNGWSWWHSLG